MATVRDLEQQNLRLSSAVQDLQLTVAKVDTQVKRIISDIESEKGTRERSDARLEEKLDTMEEKITEELKSQNAKADETSKKLERIFYMVGGAIVVITPFAGKLMDAVSKFLGLE